VSERVPPIEDEPVAAALNQPGLLRDAHQREAEEHRVQELQLDWRRVMRRRLGLFAALLALWVVAIESRLVFLQVFQHEELANRAERQRSKTIAIPGKRGELLDRAGRVLAYSVDGDAVFAEPTIVREPARVAARVCQAIDGCTPDDQKQMAERLSQQRPFTYLWRRATPADAERVRALKIRGVGLLREDRRYYPHRELAAHVLGYVGLDGDGLGGIEAACEELIAGQPGKMLLQTDAKQNAFARVQKPPTAGATLELTIDAYLQFVTERELRRGVEEFGARGGSVVIMDPNTGDILALANWPTFNPNAYNAVRDEQRRNRAVQEVYEPGSTFKVVTASAAIEEHVAGPTDVFDVSRGAITFGPRTIRDVHRYGPLSFTDVIVKSSNVGAILIGQRVGPERMARYVSAFGFGQPALRVLRGESRGIVWDVSRLNASALASVSMGYQIGVTPIQMATAVSAIANGGQLVAPRIVRAVIRDGRRAETPTRVVRRTVTPETAATLTTIMEAVVAEGTAKAAQLDGYTVAGKTGTAAKLENGRYSKSDYNGSFVGFVPSRRPALTVLVVIDSPHGKGYYGGVVAAPVFKRVAEQALLHLGIAPTINPEPPVIVARHDGAEGTRPAMTRATSVLAPILNQPAANGLMPELRGMSAREAVQTLVRLGLVPRVVGDGLVSEQDLAPGMAIERGATVVVHLERRTPPPPPATEDGP
jgi:cell division protein FtsI (penicillin-binding protein 3)